MSETTTVPTERWKRLVLLLTLINTILVSVIAGLQSDANVRASKANRDSQYYAMLASSELIQSGIRSNYDMESLSQVLANTQESLVLQVTALEQQAEGNADAAALSIGQAAVLQARADRARAFSVLFTDPRYAPATADDLPDAEQYLADQNQTANDIVVKQNAAADEYQKWNGKSDAYVTILTILAVAFFLLGIAQSSAPRLRLLFAAVAFLVMTVSSLWTFTLVIF